ncbi:MAG TPA: TetM/TetW/TetO/TetS family tetracycline resistance ribosomal protection protein [Candidatus Anaerostipes excrementavium]|uniref:TetM/TetW/TetO/TetS family tetracycline resistance ribosomal protection protein n=1 Tax=Candidatus Anaerostipes excrementavium TaxID=2838463 RepID=A0A9D1WUX5_9FIRM|nr:TetM/TetW/TetO/TetS family tetracycline resistance ribosomal protection protein [Candidatus Anaerostipes excrementavium]
MENTSEKNNKKTTENMSQHICTALLAHVDAGKTTLSEAILYSTGQIRKLGRVDHGDAYFDSDTQERERGITIFSKQAVFSLGSLQVTLLDTPGHADFSAEMERTLQVLDYAILVISGADGVQSHTKTLWKLFSKYEIPVFLFVNKMDQPGTNKDALIEELKKTLSEGCIDFGEEGSESFFEAAALQDEDLLDEFLEQGSLSTKEIQKAIAGRKIFPCFFGSALKLQGTEELLKGIETYARAPQYPGSFGARVYKISRDPQGSRLTHLKVTGGTLKVKDVIFDGDSRKKSEKVNQIRIYSGEKYQLADEAAAGTICAVTGLTDTRPGQGLGMEEDGGAPMLEPVLTYQMILPPDCSVQSFLPKLYQLMEEEPELHIAWKEEQQEIQVQLMGEVQIDILKRQIMDRYGVEVEFGSGKILYRETIADQVEGIGHFEPLRHYAEVHLILEPGPRGSGMVFESGCSEDVLDRNWQRLILTHLKEKEHLGVLTGSPLTDIKIRLAAGKSHAKHTEGGDFREATYRAVRQGLMQAHSVLLEPYYEFRLEVPQTMIGRAMTDIERMGGTMETPLTEGEMAVLEGIVPAAHMQDYFREVTAYTKGQGKLFCSFHGYEPCQDTQKVIEEIGYDPERDVENPSGSVFCSHGAGFYVPWQEVKDYMHIDSVLQSKKEDETADLLAERRAQIEEEWIDTEEIDRILQETLYANQSRKNKWKRKKTTRLEQDYRSSAARASVKRDTSRKYLLVDGYNIIYAWDDLRELSEANLDASRGKLIDLLCNYQSLKKCELIVVFDAYRVKGHDTEVSDYQNIHVVFTKEAETADQYIEKFAHEHGRKYDVTVATSDGLEQVIIRGQGCRLLSARELKEDMEEMSRQLREGYLSNQETGKNYLVDGISEAARKELEKAKES